MLWTLGSWSGRRFPGHWVSEEGRAVFFPAMLRVCDVIKCLLLLLPCRCMHRMLEKSGGAHTEPALLRLLRLHSDPPKQSKVK